MTYDREERAVMDAFIAEFPDGRVARNALAGGEFEEAWLWILDLAAKKKPIVSDGLRSRILEHLTKYYPAEYVIEVRNQLDALPRRSSAA